MFQHCPAGLREIPAPTLGARDWEELMPDAPHGAMWPTVLNALSFMVFVTYFEFISI